MSEACPAQVANRGGRRPPVGSLSVGGVAAVTDSASQSDGDRQLAAADAAARNPEPLDRRLEAIAPMTDESWDSFAIEDLSEDEATEFWQTVAG